MEYPTDELLFTNYLAAHSLGVEVHGCGLIDAETRGHLLLGHSGAGKSTTAYLWQSLRNPEILSDDRLILRIENGELWMHGTPWHGEGQFASPNKAKLNRILILQHGTRNELIEMSRAHAAAELFARCFPPFHSPEGLQNVMDFLNKVVNLVPCYEFRFVPDASAVEAVIEMERESLMPGPSMLEERPQSAAFSDVAEALACAGISFRFKALGQSMYPTILNGEMLHVEPLGEAKLRPSDIVLFKSNGIFKVHRIVRMGRDQFCTRGDASLQADGVVRREQILGRVIAKECSETGRRITLAGLGARAGFQLRRVRSRIGKALRKRLTTTDSVPAFKSRPKLDT